ncbi:MAG: phenylalanine--tRNA ligase subunit beta [Nitrospirota bacterium]
MRISYNWLREFVKTDLTPQQMSDRLTMAGLEVEALEYLGEGISGVIVGKIISVNPHPDADKLTVCDVDTGSEVLPIVCGAKNMKAGDKAPLALSGASLPGGLKITKAKLRGVTSFGMLCSEKELGLAKDSTGLMLLPEDAPVGEDIVKAIGLDDWAMEVNVTPNRPDCLSVLGISREAVALTREELRMPHVNLKESGGRITDMIGVEIKDAGLCPRYAGRIIKGVRIAQSPDWMKMRLKAVGVRPINNVVDVTNYVMMEMGQPLHAFDYDLLEDKEIIVRAAAEGEVFTTLDGTERKLSDGMLLICDGKRPVALAGVMGGQNSEVSDGTVNVFIEAAYFNPSSIRRTSKKLGLHTEASHRFERGTDPEGLILALDRAAALMAELAGGKIAKGQADEYPKRIEMPEVKVRVAKVNSILGADLDKSEIKDIFTRLRLDIKNEDSKTLTVEAPPFRPDLTREVDMVEEVARIHGYGKIRSALPEYAMNPGAPDKIRGTSGKIKAAMLASGYNEVINYSFIDPRDLDRILLPEDDYRRKVVTLRNPLTVEQSVMRTTLIPSLIGNLSWNLSRGVRDVRIFEISKVFLSEGPGLPSEPLYAAALATGKRGENLWDARDGAIDFYDIKGMVDTLLDSLRITGAVYTPAEEIPFLHPGKSAWIMVGGKGAGYLGELHPGVIRACDLPVGAYIFELDLQSLLDLEPEPPKYSPLPRFPSVERDVAVIVPEEVTSFSIMRVIESLKIELIEDIRLFDYYAGKPIPEGKKSLAYTITYRSTSRTLTDEEVNEVHQAVVAALREKLGAEIREQ